MYGAAGPLSLSLSLAEYALRFAKLNVTQLPG